MYVKACGFTTLLMLTTDDIFNFISELARDLLGFANQVIFSQGFLLRVLLIRTKGTIFLTAATVPKLEWFLVTTLPAVIFFVALVQLLFYNGILQWFIEKFAVFFFWSMVGAFLDHASPTP